MNKRAQGRFEAGNSRTQSHGFATATRRFRTARAANDNHLPFGHRLAGWPILTLLALGAGSLFYLVLRLAV